MARVLCTIFSRQTKNRNWKAGRAAMPDSNIIQIDQNLFETKLDRLVTEKMTQILNAMLDAEADEITGAARYERKEGRKAYRAGHYERTLTAKAGRLELRVPKLKGAVFESAVIERYRRRESSVEEALMEMCLAGVSTRQVDDISKLLWGDRMPSQTLSDKLKRVYDDIDRWRTRPLESEYPYVFMDGVWHKRSWGGSVENVSVLVAIGVNAEGHREVIGVTEGHEGGRCQLGAVHTKHDRTRFEGRAPRGRRPVRGTRLHGELDASPGEVPAVHGALHAQRALEGAAQPPGLGVRGPEGDIRHGVPRIRPRQGRDGRRGDGVQEAQGGGRLPARGHRGDDRLPFAGIPDGAPQEDPHEQHDRTAEPGDPASHARRRQFPGRQQRVDAHLRQNQVRHRERMEHAPLPRHVPAR